MSDYFDIKDICKLLPHRFPMLLVDRILEINDDGGIGYKNVTINEDFFNGHFPGAPVMPGVLQIEGLAQCSGFVALMYVKNRYPEIHMDDILIFFMSLDNVKFRKPVVPGDRLEYRTQISKRRESIAKDQKSFTRIINSFDAQGYVDEQLVCECSLTAMLVPKENNIL